MEDTAQRALMRPQSPRVAAEGPKKSVSEIKALKPIKSEPTHLKSNSNIPNLKASNAVFTKSQKRIEDNLLRSEWQCILKINHQPMSNRKLERYRVKLQGKRILFTEFPKEQ